MNKLILVLSALLIISNSQIEQQVEGKSMVSIDIKETIRKQQYKSKEQNQMNYQNIQSYTIKAQRTDSFLLTPQADQQVKCQFYIYWKQGNIFISSEYRQGQEIRVIVTEDNMHIVIDRSFYMVNGFKFNVKKGSIYEIRFYSNGAISKLVSLTVSKILDTSQKLIDTSDLTQTESKINKLKGQIQAFFSISERNYIIETKLTEQVLSSTKLYMGYEIVQILIVLGITIFQTIFVTRILNTESIV